MQATKPKKYYVPHRISGGGGRNGQETLPFLIHPKKTSDLTHIVLRGAMRELTLLLVRVCVCVLKITCFWERAKALFLCPASGIN